MNSASPGMPERRGSTPGARITARACGALAVGDHGVAALRVAAEPGDGLDLAQVGAELLGLLLHLLGEVEAGDALGEAGVVLDELGEGDLAAGHVALEDDGVEAAAAAVDAGREAGRAGADDDDVDVGGGVAGGFRHEVSFVGGQDGGVGQREYTRGRSPPRSQQLRAHELLGDLHRVERRALAQVVGDDPQVEAVLDGDVLADAADVHRVLALGVERQRVLQLAPGRRRPRCRARRRAAREPRRR